MTPIRVLLVEDHKIVQQGIKQLLATDEEIQIIGETDSGLEAVTKARELKPDVILMDIQLKDLDGIEATSRIRSQVPRTKVLILSMHEEKGYASRAVKNGANGYLLKNVSARDLISAIRRVAGGESVIHPQMVGKLFEEFTHLSEGQQWKEHMTRRELEILREIGRGKSNRDIARTLVISDQTVKTHLHTIFQKLNVTSRVQAVTKAIHLGLLEPESSAVGPDA